MNRASASVSVVLSFYNEQAVLPELLSRLRMVFASLMERGQVRFYELVFVNDNSTDASEAYLRSELGRGDIVLVSMSRNFGVSECVMAGMAHAGGDAVIYMDADLQDPPEVIPRLVEAWMADPEVEVVYTTRTSRQGESRVKMFVTKIGYRFINAISDIELQVDSGDFKLLSRRAVECLLQLKEDKPYMRGLVSWIGFKQVPVYYDRLPRHDGRQNTKMNVLSRKVIYYWLDRALISFSDAPLKLMLVLGFILSGISMSYILVVIAQKIMGVAVPGLSAIMSAVLFLGSLQIMLLGFVGLYIGAIFREVKQRPRYLVKEVLRK
ncbi:MAG: glycosyltransferase family 2 protein [Nitrospira sp.]|nr:glycosyltransferase family 2 protein [Nitrospira sp.]